MSEDEDVTVADLAADPYNVWQACTALEQDARMLRAHMRHEHAATGFEADLPLQHRIDHLLCVVTHAHVTLPLLG